MKKLPIIIKLLAVFIFIAIIAILSIYFYHFDATLGNNNDFGTFGDFIGGTLNPLLSFFTIVLLIWSLRVQTEELKLSRQELAKSSTALDAAQRAHHQNVRLQKREYLRRQVEDDFNHHWERYQNLFNKEILHPRDIPLSLYKMTFKDQHKSGFVANIATGFIDSIPQRMLDPNDSSMGTQVLNEIAIELDSMTNSVVELFKFLDTHVVARSIHNRVEEALSECHDLKILDEKIYNIFLQRIIVPNNINQGATLL